MPLLMYKKHNHKLMKNVNSRKENTIIQTVQYYYQLLIMKGPPIYLDQ